MRRFTDCLDTVLRLCAVLVAASPVVVLHASSGFSKVSFAEPVRNVTVAVGRETALSCVVDNLGSHRVAWVHLDRAMILTIHRNVVTRIGRFSVSFDHQRTWHLHIRNVQSEDAGRYMCQVNTEPMLSQVGHVHVVVPPAIVDEDSSPSQLSVRENSRVSLLCRAKGVPSARVSWKREDGRPIVEGKADNATVIRKSDAGRTVIAQDGEELVFTKISRTDSAAYLCIASNGVPPSVSKRIILDVEFEPYMIVPNQLLGSPIGGTLTLECLAEAQPRPIAFWMRADANNVNGVMLLPSKRHKIDTVHTGYTTHMRLLIHQVSAEDIGQYRCVAKNSLGEAEGSIRVYEMMTTPPSTKYAEARPTWTPTTSAAAVMPAVRDLEDEDDEQRPDLGDYDTPKGFSNNPGPHDTVYGDQIANKQANGRKNEPIGYSRSHGAKLSIHGASFCVTFLTLLRFSVNYLVR